MTGRIKGRFFAGFLSIVCVATGVMAETCGGEAAPCKVRSGMYYATVAPKSDGVKRPVLLFFHGAGGLGTSVLGEKSDFKPFVDAGYVVIGAQGLMRDSQAFGTGWSFRPESPQLRDELAYAHEVLDDVVMRFDADRSRVLVSGFSIGGSLVWYLACKDPGLGAAYAPIAGGFWRPHPVTCKGPIDLLHTHGWRDRTVPLEGRPLRGGAIRQGDIPEGLQLWRAMDKCAGERPDVFSTSAEYWIRTWNTCETGRQMALALHPGDHDMVPTGWPTLAMAWFADRLKAR